MVDENRAEILPIATPDIVYLPNNSTKSRSILKHKGFVIFALVLILGSFFLIRKR